MALLEGRVNALQAMAVGRKGESPVTIFPGDSAGDSSGGGDDDDGTTTGELVVVVVVLSGLGEEQAWGVGKRLRANTSLAEREFLVVEPFRRSSKRLKLMDMGQSA